MSQQNQGQLIKPPTALRLKAGSSRPGGIDLAAIARAEAALRSLSGNFDAWLADEIAKLEAARRDVRTLGPSDQTLEALYLRAHDLKGLGTTYGFPLITRLAGLLCRLLEDKDTRLRAPMALVDAHIDAIKAAVRDNIKAEDHPVGKALITELQRQLAELGA